MFSQWGVIDFYAYLLGVIVIILLPGPNSLFVLAVGGRLGCRAGLRAIAGILVGDSILMIFVFLGMASLLKNSLWLFTFIKLLGGGYLAYLGLSLLSDSWRKMAKLTDNLPLGNANVVYSDAPFIRALMLSLSNPKALLFLLSYFIQFINVNYHYPFIPFSILAITLNSISCCYLLLLLTCGIVIIRKLTKYYWLTLVGNLLLAILFILFAIKVLLAPH